MDKVLQTILIISTIFFTIFVFVKTNKRKLNYKLTILWLCLCIFTIILAVFPEITIRISETLHIEKPVNALFLMFIFLIIVLLFYMSIEISSLQNKLTILIQKSALSQKRNEEKENENK